MTDNESNSETYFDDYNNTDVLLNQTLAEQVTSAVIFYYTPLLIALGTIGNLVSVFVFYSSKLRLQSTSQYLSALAISDTIFLFQLLPPWLNAVQLTDLFNRKGFCQIFVYVTYVTCCLSAWLVVAFTVERFVAVLYPLQRNAICTVTRARHIICSIVIAALLLNVPVLRFAKATKHDCSIDYDYMDYAARFNLVDTIVTFSAPLIVIIIMNTWIMIGVYRLERARHQLMKAEQPQPLAGQRGRPARLLGCPPSQQRVTRMLLIVSSVFVVLNMPAYTMRMLAYAYDMTSGENSGRWAALQQVATMFFDTNFGINFILYCLSGQNFRRALRQTLPWLRRRARRGVAVRRAASCHPARASSVSTSFVSNCTEATTNCPVAVSTPSTRRRRREPFITRWTFDNSRQRHQPPVDHFEMRAFPAAT
ncbi:neuromedin-U receptor 1 [Pectinophora gossypiella]|uniref:neuromedin-U receptor 1 n=1 Tax=Pectinophora gossypiella TaxID=13191 RepID=UPI00214DFBF2|nr:neuromedin-U receptor 1 [Pectinophora gossypiella]